MDKEHFKKLERVASFLDEIEDHRFYFGSIVVEWNNDKTCGAVCCALGHLPNIFKESFDWCFVKELNNNPISRNTDGREELEEFFGLSYKEILYLFYPDSEYNNLTDQTTKCELAEHIRNFIKTKSQEQNASCQTG